MRYLGIDFFTTAQAILLHQKTYAHEVVLDSSMESSKMLHTTILALCIAWR